MLGKPEDACPVIRFLITSQSNRVLNGEEAAKQKLGFVLVKQTHVASSHKQ